MDDMEEIITEKNNGCDYFVTVFYLDLCALNTYSIFGGARNEAPGLD